MPRLINIDNGGTLTDICVADPGGVRFTKTLTTPFDLSQCLFDGLGKASEVVYGHSDLAELLRQCDYIRYSTTQGTNALVQRKGPRLGLLTDDATLARRMEEAQPGGSDLYAALLGDRVAALDTGGSPDDLDARLVAGVNDLTQQGAGRLVVSFVGQNAAGREQHVKAALLRLYPSHLLGVVPVLVARELTADADDVRRTWSAVLNAFLHPSMERFLFFAEQRLQGYRTRHPLLVFRNDGGSSRVAKACALKTYSSGPRGGLEGARALAAFYGFDHVLMADVGGTTTDIGIIDGGKVVVNRRGHVDGVLTSFELSDISSYGAGGSSIIKAVEGRIQVGPESVGAAPGPACFGLGGTAATITDVYLLMGILDASTYLGGTLRLDVDRSAAAVVSTVGEPLGLSLDEALIAMQEAFLRRVAEVLKASSPRSDTVLASFGGGGPMSACGAARLAGIRRIVVPRTAAVFSAFGIGFSDLSQTYEHEIVDSSPGGLAGGLAGLRERAARDFAAEQRTLEELRQEVTVVVEDGAAVTETPVREGDWPTVDPAAGTAYLTLRVTAPLEHVRFDTPVSEGSAAATTREILDSSGGRVLVPVRPLETIAPGEQVTGPLVIEGPFFTMPVPGGWRVSRTPAGDLSLADEEGAS